MNTETWRTVIVESASDMAIKDGNFRVGEALIPLDQIRQVVVSSPMGSISIPAVNRLLSQNASVILCGDKHTPICTLAGTGTHFERAGKLMDQSAWTDRRKDAIWRQIVQQKISQQMKLLERLGRNVPDQMQTYLMEVRPGDETNREAMAARVYFDELFGIGFIRFDNDVTNAALNYGYTILRTAFDRAIVMHGYCTELGIHHCSRQNPYNLSCDLMEPFRPFVDEVVAMNPGRELDLDYRKELISFAESKCIYDGSKMSISKAIEYYTLDVTRRMSEPKSKIGKVGFYD